MTDLRRSKAKKNQSEIATGVGIYLKDKCDDCGKSVRVSSLTFHEGMGAWEVVEKPQEDEGFSEACAAQAIDAVLCVSKYERS